MINDKIWLKPKEVISVTGFSRTKLRALRENNSLQFKRIGNVFYYYKHSVDLLVKHPQDEVINLIPDKER